LKYKSTSARPTPCICGTLQTLKISGLNRNGLCNPVNGYDFSTLCRSPTEDWRTGSSKVLFKSVGYMRTAALRISGRCRLIF
ncbi:MAG: hypothetical protein NWR42_04815, partial [Desulfobacterales bacterium]|nr:hypothetical protein [Desulfobacterales bacterium]